MMAKCEKIYAEIINRVANDMEIEIEGIKLSSADLAKSTGKIIFEFVPVTYGTHNDPYLFHNYFYITCDM